MDTKRMNDTLVENTELMLEDPFNYTARNFQPKAGSPVLNSSYWYEPTGLFDQSKLNDNVLILNYPNPFSGFTFIDITVDQLTPVQVRVYDMSGKMAASLYEGIMAPGRTTLTFNAEFLAKGIYIGKVVTAKEEKVFKMIAR